ncbi:hypothetical protein JM16_001074 [Phytophthora kernoviae]|uniref:Phosphatidic acid phosphatase type 2/haloperoxidase domain-containing protein n=1 Tax=Phytophthora kernoviae TaxID=325452 RepID=A0A8T0M7V4_9STRA|nr:hypothetical protein JM16_001074 [Phytophthora kernoviae]
MYLIAKAFSLMAVNDRPIPRIQIRLNSTTTIWARDPAVDEVMMTEQVPMWSLITFGLGIPIAVNVFLNYVLPKCRDIRAIPHDVRDFLLSLVQAITLATLLTKFTKHATGRFRPSFYDMCGWDYDVVWDGVTNLFSACLAYSYNYGSIFCWQYAGLPCEAIHDKLEEETQGIGLQRSGDANDAQEKLHAVNMSAIPRIEMRLNSTTSIWGRDPAIDQEKLSQRVPMWLLVVVGLAIPIMINLVVNYMLPKIVGVRVIAHDVRDYLLSLGQAITLSTFLVNFTKNVTGRFRPCFYDDCGWNYDVMWDGITNLCSDPSGERDGRQSFPSGHASFAWSVMGVLTLYLLGRSRLNCENRSESLLHDGVKTFKFFFCFLPCLGAAWVAITRTLDNRHHYSDIVAGSVIGAASACLAYYHNYGSIYSWDIASDVPFMESITSVSEVPGIAGPDSRPRTSKWERIVRDYRLAEFAISALMYGFALFFAKIDVAQRDIPNIEVRLNSTTSVWARDPTINNKEHVQQVPMAALVGIGGGVPVIINLIINYALPKCRPVRIIPHDTRDFLLTMVQSTSMATLLTQFTKNMTGRFRPCFYDMCKWDYDVVWDGVTNLCTSASGEKEGRKSFPSGHASFAWSTMLVLTLYLLGRSTLNCQNRTWVAVTRSIDNWHHYADILAGSIIGAVSACLSYSYNYSSIFHSEHAGVPLQQCHAHSKGKLAPNSSNMTYIGSSGSLSQSTESGSELAKGPKTRNEYVMNVHNR